MDDGSNTRQFRSLCDVVEVEATGSVDSLRMSSKNVGLPCSGRTLASGERKRTAISLFSGGGGLDIGVERAGFSTLACIERDENCIATLKLNQPAYFSSAKIIQSDVNAIHVGSLMDDLGLAPGELDLLFGGPPCQSFSQIGKMGGVDDDRGVLLYAMVDYAKKLRPRAVLIENVKALQSAKDLSGERGGVLKSLVGRLERLGYRCKAEVLNSACYGVAQQRQRIFIVGIDGDADFEFPARTLAVDEPMRGVGDAIKGLPNPVRKGEEPIFPNHIDVTPAGDQKRISHVTEGLHLAKMYDAPPEIRGRLGPKDTTKFLRASRDNPSNTLRCGEVFFHPLENRYLTPREYMRIQGFPDDYILAGPIRGRSGQVKNLDQHRQVANSVPPPVACAVAKAIFNLLHIAAVED